MPPKCVMEKKVEAELLKKFNFPEAGVRIHKYGTSKWLADYIANGGDAQKLTESFSQLNSFPTEEANGEPGIKSSSEDEINKKAIAESSHDKDDDDDDAYCGKHLDLNSYYVSRYECIRCKKMYDTKAAIEKHVMDAHVRPDRPPIPLPPPPKPKSTNSFKQMRADENRSTKVKVRANEGRYMRKNVRNTSTSIKKCGNASDVDKRHDCPYCSASYASKVCFDIHVIRRHNQKEMFSCDKCIKKFKSKSLLRKHVLTEACL